LPFFPAQRQIPLYSHPAATLRCRAKKYGNHNGFHFIGVLFTALPQNFTPQRQNKTRLLPYSTSFASGKKPHLFHDNKAETRLPGYHIAQKARFAGHLCAYYSSRLANPVIIIVNTFSFSFGSR